MKISGRAWMGLSAMAVAAWMIITALEWPLRTAIFLVVIGIPVFFIALVESYQSLFGREAADRQRKEGALEFATGTDSAVAKRRTLSICLWIIGFFLLIVLIGFPIAVPLFLFVYLKLQGGEKWGISLGLAVAGWALFYSLFVHLLHVPFREGWVEEALRAFGIG